MVVVESHLRFGPRPIIKQLFLFPALEYVEHFLFVFLAGAFEYIEHFLFVFLCA